jgi:hypothetical protein
MWPRQDTPVVWEITLSKLLIYVVYHAKYIPRTSPPTVNPLCYTEHRVSLASSQSLFMQRSPRLTDREPGMA